MRIYLSEAKRVEREDANGGKICTDYPGEQFMNVPDELGEEWVDEGTAQRASLDNVRIEEPEPLPEPEIDPMLVDYEPAMPEEVDEDA